MHQELPLTKDIVLIGGGHTHALTLRSWGMSPLPGARLTLINPDPAAPYSGMLPGLVAGHYDRDALMIDLVRLARFAGARLVLGRVVGMDRAKREIHVPGRAPIRYDVASIDIGVTSDMPGIPGFGEHAFPAKPLGPFADAWERHVRKALAGESGKAVVIGAGVAGMELGMAMAHRLGPGTVTIVEAAPNPLPGTSEGTRSELLRQLERLGVTLMTGSPVVEVTQNGVVLSSGHRLPSDFTVGAAGARAQAWLAETGLKLHEGFISVGPTLASLDDPSVFAVGDCAHLSHAPRPKAGVYAVREAPVLLDNLRAAVAGLRPRSYHPQADYLKLISCGDKRAVADRSGLRTSGAWLWHWKDWIDRKFMNKFTELPAMEAGSHHELAAEGAREEAGGQPLCGGCAAKVGRGALTEALARLHPVTRQDVLTGHGDDAAVLSVGGVRQVLTTDTLRAFTDDPWMLARIAAIHALGDVWAIGAEPQAALSQIVLPRMTARLQVATLSEIMAAAEEVFSEAGAAIVGGHTATGAELSIGFTVTGLAAGRIIGQSEASPGEVLILTKALGTGVIMAAEMQMAARGDWVAGALASMSRPQGSAARLLATKASAMTDVTGFGLAGHLIGILDASGVAAHLGLNDLPTLEGAETLLERGVRSTLHTANAALRSRCNLPYAPRAELLFDPQTAGGLLASVPAVAASGLVSALRDEGFPAAVIGHIEAGPPEIHAD